ncbi:MAG: ATP-binding protein [Actinophytocola sp.]|uniref:hybrid sensor histidine kinase/response regulator n=1 Tax=Actinophytocola sp. TaxID=1872138 RepID=UPI003D6C0EF9
MTESSIDFRGLFDAAPTPYLVLAPDLTIVAVNQAYLTATKTRRETLVGQPIFSAFPDNPDDGSADGVRNLRRSLETALATGEPDTMALQRYDIPVGSDGRFEERYWSPINTPIRADDGTITHIIHRVLDVTEFVRSAGRAPPGALARVSELEADLFARAREVQDMNRRLREANSELATTTAELRAQQEAKDRFIATLSHELRNPLAAIHAAVELLGFDVPAGHPSLGVLERQTATLTRMTDDLLDATRALTGRLELDRRRVDLREVVEDTAADVGAEFAAGSRTLRILVPPLPVPVDGDRMRLAQLLGNLVSNAGKYTEPGATIVVSLAAEDGSALLTVSDDGIGFAPALTDSLFEVFTRVAPVGTTAVSGLGLGLAIVRTICELHGGTVTAHSDGQGMGAEFRVRLPLAVSSDVDGPAPVVPVHREPLRILVIEDNADLGYTYRALLERRGDTVTVVTTGLDGLETAASTPFDVVLCDIGLPDIDGLQVARHLRAQPETQGLVLVAVSGFIQEDDKRRALAAGFDAYLPKPMSPAELDRVLVELTDKVRR